MGAPAVPTRAVNMALSYPMRESVILIGFVTMLSTAAPRLLRHARWPDRAPRVGIAVWLGLSGAAVAGMFAASLAAALALPPVNHGVADLLRACLHLYHVDFDLAAPGTVIGAAGAVMVVALPTWILARVIGVLRSAGRARRRHLGMIALAAQPTDDGVLVLDHPRPALYCVPGPTSRIVLTSGAIRALDPAQLAAALAHERGHLAGRHHLITGLADGLAAALPLPLLRGCRAAVRRLVELAADDHVTRVHAPAALAEAVVAVAAGPVPAGAFGAGDVAIDRVTRLVHPPRRLGVCARVAATVMVSLAFAVPIATGGLALTGAVATDPCGPTATAHT